MVGHIWRGRRPNGLGRIFIALGLMALLTACPMNRAAPPRFPTFPLPAPQPSARHVIARAQLPNANTLGQVDARIRAALSRGRYTDPSYFAVYDGFAMVSQMERIQEDGKSWPDQAGRWQTGPVSLLPADAGIWRQILAVLPGSQGPSHAGRYRVIVFLVTTAPVLTTASSPTQSEAEAWLDKGAQRLPSSIAARPFTIDHDVIALVYDFKRDAVADRMKVLRPSPLTAPVHLTRAQIFPL